MAAMLRRLGEFLRRRRSALSSAAELTGMGLVALAGWRISPTLGIALAGCILVFVGYSTGGRR